MRTVTVETRVRVEFVDVTHHLEAELTASGARSGVLVAYVPHTTAGVTINENADPSVCRDLITALGRLVPADLPFAHAEGNADAHVKASLLGSSVTIPVEDGRLLLGTWQGVYLAEFDGPRRRRLLIRVVDGGR